MSIDPNNPKHIQDMSPKEFWNHLSTPEKVATGTVATLAAAAIVGGGWFSIAHSDYVHDVTYNNIGDQVEPGEVIDPEFEGPKKPDNYVDPSDPTTIPSPEQIHSVDVP